MVLLLILLSFCGLAVSQTPTPRPPALDSRAYQFTRVNGTSGINGAAGNLTSSGAGKVISFNSCPTGLAVDSYVFLTGGTGIDEAALVTATTCTLVGGLSGTLTVTTIKVHIGSWRVQSSSSGVQEAIYATGGNGRVIMPAYSVIDFYGFVIIPGTYNVSLRGAGKGSTDIHVHGLTGNWIWYKQGSAGYADVGGFSIRDASGTMHTSGSMVRVSYKVYGSVSDIEVENGFWGIVMEACHNIGPRDCVVGAVEHGIYITTFGGLGSLGIQSEVDITNCRCTLTGSSGSAFHIEGQTVGVTLTGCVGNTVLPAPNNRVLEIHVDSAVGATNEIQIIGGLYDAAGVGIAVIGDGVAYNNNFIIFEGVEAAGSEYGVFIDAKAGNIKWTGGLIKAGGGTAAEPIFLRDTKNVKFNSVDLEGVPAVSATAVRVNGVEDVTLDNISIGKYAGNVPINGVAFSGTALRFTLQNSDLSLVPGSMVVSPATAGNPLWLYNNLGIDNVTGAVASATSTTLPLNSLISITGTNTITTMGMGWPGRRVRLIKSDTGTAILTTGGNITTEAFLYPGGALDCLFGASSWSCSPDVYHPSIKGLTAGNGNIVLQPGNVAGNSSVVIETTRTDEAALLIKDHSGTNAHDIVEIRDSSGNAYFAILPMSHTIDPGTVITKSIVPLTAGCCEVGTPTRRWGKGSFAAIDAQGGTVGVGNLVVDTDIIVGTGIVTVGDVGVGGKLTTGDTVSAPNGYIVGGIPGITRTFTMIKTVNFGASTTTTCTIIVTLGIVTGGTC